MVEISNLDTSPPKGPHDGDGLQTSLPFNIVGSFVAVVILVYGAIRVKKAGLSFTSQTSVNSVPSFSATATVHETTSFTHLFTKSVNAFLKHSRLQAFWKFWKRFPNRLWNFYVNAFLIPAYRQEWGKYQTWHFRSPPRPRTPLLLKAHHKKVKTPKEKESAAEPARVVTSGSVQASSSSRRSVSLHPVAYTKDEDPLNPQPKPHNHSGCQKVRINVGGCIYETQQRTLDRYPHTLLGDHNRRLRFFCPIKQEYFFDRHQTSFEAILYYYQSGGRFKRPDYVPADILLDDAKFYGLPQAVIYQYLIDEGLSAVNDAEEILPANLFLRKVWLLFEHPQSSMQAQIVSLISIVAIVLSISTFCIETLESLSGRYRYFMDVNKNVVFGVNIGQILDLHDPFFIIETLCSSWFIVEYLVRLISSPIKWDFITNTLNIIDLIAVLPYCFTLILAPDRESRNNDQNQAIVQSKRQGAGLSIIRIVRLVRVFRIFKLSRHSRGLKILGKTLQASLNELMLLVFFVVIGVILFASMMYFAEVGDKTSSFQSIPHGFWWALITLTTVGYGDDVPKTTGGRFVGALCAVAGVLTLALPVPVIVSNFNFFYHQALGESDLSWIRINHSVPCPFRPMDGFAGTDPSPYSNTGEHSKHHVRRHGSSRRSTNLGRVKPAPTYSSDEEFGQVKVGRLEDTVSRQQ